MPETKEELRQIYVNTREMPNEKVITMQRGLLVKLGLDPDYAVSCLNVINQNFPGGIITISTTTTTTSTTSTTTTTTTTSAITNTNTNTIRSRDNVKDAIVCIISRVSLQGSHDDR